MGRDVRPQHLPNDMVLSTYNTPPSLVACKQGKKAGYPNRHPPEQILHWFPNTKSPVNVCLVNIFLLIHSFTIKLVCPQIVYFPDIIQNVIVK